MIITRTPFRISFFGGGTDYPAWFSEHGGAVLATSIDKYCYISCRKLPPFFQHKHRIIYSKIENVSHCSEIAHPAVRALLEWMQIEDGLEIHHDADLPARSGLGSSSSFTVGLLHVLQTLAGRMSNKKQLASDAIHIEQNVIGEHVGSQDQISTAFGGFNRIEFQPDGAFHLSPVIMPMHRRETLNQHFMLFFTGFSRIASKIAQTKIANFRNRTCELQQMYAMVDQAINILQDEQTDITTFGELLHQNWIYKRNLSPCVSTPKIDAIYDRARRAGAIGGKLLGAGGGGFMLLFAAPEKQVEIRQQLSSLTHVPFKFEHSGSQIVLNQPNGL